MITCYDRQPIAYVSRTTYAARDFDASAGYSDGMSWYGGVLGVGSKARLMTVADERILRQRYEALRNDRVERVTVRAHRALLTDSFGLLLAIVVFVFHWRWVRRLGGSSVNPSTS